MISAIKSGTSLRETKKKISASLKSEIEQGITLRQTMPKLATPVRTQINSRPALRKTKMSMPTPIKQQIAQNIPLRHVLRTVEPEITPSVSAAVATAKSSSKLLKKSQGVKRLQNRGTAKPATGILSRSKKQLMSRMVRINAAKKTLMAKSLRAVVRTAVVMKAAPLPRRPKVRMAMYSY